MKLNQDNMSHGNNSSIILFIAIIYSTGKLLTDSKSNLDTEEIGIEIFTFNSISRIKT
jgi:hypothetical protein